jgi:predicted  nucleic acid-binding Zn-ribbon protein
MKKCPQCGTVYEDNFMDQCPRDYARLEFVNEEERTSVSEEDRELDEIIQYVDSELAKDAERAPDEQDESKTSSTGSGCAWQVLTSVVFIILYVIGALIGRACFFNPNQ